MATMPACSSCSMEKTNLLKCSRCKSVFYCSKECQKLHWKAHKPYCEPSQTLAIPDLKTKFPQPSRKDSQSLAKFVCSSLKKDYFSIIDDLFEHKKAVNILDDVKKLYTSGIFQDGQLSGGKTASDDKQKFVEKRIRGDEITWLEGNEEHVPNIVKLIEYVDSLVICCSKLPGGLSGHRIEGRAKAMVACYPGNGTGYTRHVDNPDGDGRCLTVIYYLNQGWGEDKGGKLRIYREDSHIDVEPILNRLLMFWSNGQNPHEVLPAYCTRYAITIWYFDAEQRRKAKQLHSCDDMGHLEAEFALMDVEAKRKERDLAVEKLKEESERLVKNLLSEEELDALSALVKHHASPNEVLTGLGIEQSVQEAFLKLLVRR